MIVVPALPSAADLPNLSGTSWAAVVLVAIVVVGGLTGLAMCLHGSTPEQRPVILRAVAALVRAIGDAIRFLRPRRRRR